ncbi:anthranilate synthase component II [Aestuariivirga sp.]|jgi:anthranilate synthase/aminodeoxychorismate synthase-like glutamine amidotransferase|uniref:anthranilate synthase component II n=1 Tax=Aestuariivirga sp. TaxID=2650926 RepID=UPI0037841E39
MILIVDNYDSFVHNIARYLVELGADCRVVRNDRVNGDDLDTARAIIISPGPCTPQEAGQSMDIIRNYSGRRPILGICLGHQAIGAVFGGRVTRARRPMHGEASEIAHDGNGLFKGLPPRFSAGRYHSLIVELADYSGPLMVTAQSEDGEIMGLRHASEPTYGVQFHPESILTEGGYDLLQNFLELTR